ncbi:MAG: VWA domain-containing protein [Bryobacteraceae bacterium]
MISLLAIAALPALQAAAGTHEFTLRSEVRLVLLDVSVTSREGEFVSGLGAASFRIFDNGRERPIAVFASEDQPVTVGLVIDGSGSMAAKRHHVIQAATTLIEFGNPGDEVFVVSFGDRVTFPLPPDVPFTSDRAQLRQALIAMPLGGRTSLTTVSTPHLGIWTGARAAGTRWW